jgi:hypothetical protein
MVVLRPVTVPTPTARPSPRHRLTIGDPRRIFEGQPTSAHGWPVLTPKFQKIPCY